MAYTIYTAKRGKITKEKTETLHLQVRIGIILYTSIYPSIHVYPTVIHHGA